MKLITIKLNDYKPHPQNPNTHPEHQLDELGDSLGQFGQFKNVVVWKGYYLAGHGLVEAARRKGLKTLKAVDVSHLPEEKAKSLMVADNRLPELGVMDEELLTNLLKEFDDALTIPGIDLDFMKNFDFGEDGDGDAEPQIDKAEELNKTWKVKIGDLWQIGEHRLLCGDSTKADDALMVMNKEHGQMSVTSPPYGVGKSYETKGIGPWFDTVRPVIKNICENVDVAIWQLVDLYSTGGQFIEPTLAYSINMFLENGFKTLWIRIWEKQGQNHGVGPYHLVSNKPVQQYEYIASFGEEKEIVEETDYEWIATFGNSKYKFTRRLSRNDKKSWGYAGVWKINTVKANDVHVAMYPLELPARVIKMHSDVSGIVFDPFLGSGTTMVACQNLNRKCRGIEISPDYCAVILQRMTDAFPGIEIRRME